MPLPRSPADVACSGRPLRRPFARSQELLKEAPNEFERARTQLCWGRRLVAAGRVDAARDHLYEALKVFTFLEAATWVDRTREVLQETGDTPPHAAR